MNGKVAISSKWVMHFICWSIPFVSTLLPLSTNSFNRDDDSQIGWCFLSGNQVDADYWVVFSFYLIMFGCLMIMSYFIISIYIKYRQLGMGSNYPEVQNVVDAMKMYPILMIINWGPNLIFSILLNFGVIPQGRGQIHLFDAINILATQNGTFTMILFFVKSKEARFRWFRLVSYLCKPRDNERKTTGSTIPLDFSFDQQHENAKSDVAPPSSIIPDTLDRSRNNSVEEGRDSSISSFSRPSMRYSEGFSLYRPSDLSIHLLSRQGIEQPMFTSEFEPDEVSVGESL